MSKWVPKSTLDTFDYYLPVGTFELKGTLGKLVLFSKLYLWVPLVPLINID